MSTRTTREDLQEGAASKEIADAEDRGARKERAAIVALVQAHAKDCRHRGLRAFTPIIDGITSEIEDGMQHDPAHVAGLLTH